MRVARPTVSIEALLRFYRDGLGLAVIGSFQDHEGFDGFMLGMPGSSYHLEFTCKRGHNPGLAPTQDNLLVFYLPDNTEWQAAVDRMVAHGYTIRPRNELSTGLDTEFARRFAKQHRCFSQQVFSSFFLLGLVFVFSHFLVRCWNVLRHVG